MRKCGIALLLTILAALPLMAQRSGDGFFQTAKSSIETYAFDFSLSDFDIISDGDYCTIAVQGFSSSSQEAGNPELPVFHQIIAVPQGATPKLNFTVGPTVSRSLGQRLLHPAQPHQFKNRPADFVIDNEVYARDAFFALPAVSITELGTMRGLRLLRITVSPFQYNPQHNVLLFHSIISAEITFEGADVQATVSELERHHGISPVAAVANRAAFLNLLSHQRQIPPKFVVVAQDTFQKALQPFLQWKRQKGFNVVEVYTRGGDTCTYIRSRLDSLWRSATPIDLSPDFIAIVGDVKHIPAFGGKIRIPGLAAHSTDLYYAEYTGDFYPEAAYGRISVADTAELTSVLNKMLAYERYIFADTAFLNRVTLVAGRESRAPAPTVTNGQINYLKRTYLSQNPDFDTHYYYNPASETQLHQIVRDLDSGASLVNYTSHCLSTGWYRPTFTSSGVDTLSNIGKYFFAVNNCCLSSRFSESRCFGEALLRKSDAGAVGVIGAANETLWEEDYYWALGAKGTVSLDAQYNPDRLGAFDRLLHTHGEPYAETATTAGEMLMAGTFGLAQMGMAYENYYWEIYNLLGDPSLMPYFGIPHNISLDYPDSVPAGTTQIALHGTPYARVALMHDTLLLASVQLDSAGLATAFFPQPIETDALLLTATAQFCKPLMDTIVVFSPRVSKMVIVSAAVSDSLGAGVADQFVKAGNAYAFDFVLKNYGGDTAKNVTLTLQSLDRKCSVPASTYRKTFILANDTACANGTFTFVPNSTLPDNDIVSLVASLFSDNGDTCVRRFDFLVRSALVEAGAVSVERNGIPVTQLRPSETYTLKVRINNSGSGISDTVLVSARIENSGGVVSSPDTVGINALQPQSSGTAEFVFSIAANATSYIDIAVSATHRGIVAERIIRLPLGKAMETFESGDFTRFRWDTTHSFAWIIDTVSSRAHAGSFCVRTAPITHKQQSVLSIAMTTIADDSITFWRRTSTEANSDYLSFLVDGVVQGKYSGSGHFERMAYFVPKGEHLFSWVYEKDGSINGDSDCAWLDDITFPLSQMDTAYHPHTGLGITVADGEKYCRVYPNPANTFFVVENLGNDYFEMTLADTYGKVVDKKMITRGEKTYYSTAKLRCGVYILIFHGKNDVFANKIIITK